MAVLLPKQGREKQDYLVFVDTNVLLDLYRTRGDSTPTGIERLKAHAGRLITTPQVLEEFERNRERVIMQALADFKLPAQPQAPALFADMEAKRLYDDAFAAFKLRHGKIIDRLERAIDHPGGDPAYKLVKQLCEASDLQPEVDGEDWSGLVARAQMRVARGSPPKKAQDISIGDAINWEWCLEICAGRKKDLIIVSRDEDYGIRRKDSSVPNSFLGQEFKARVSRKRKLVLTPRVKHALKLLGETVSKGELEEEGMEVAASSVMPRAADTFALTELFARLQSSTTSQASFIDVVVAQLRDASQGKEDET